MGEMQGTPARSRRDFLRAAGVGGVTLAVGGVLAACADDSRGALEPGAPSLAVVDGNTVTLDFRSDIDVLNYAYALEQLEAAFYTQVVATPGFETRFAPEEQTVLRDLRDHEIAHREFFRAALGTSAIPDLSVNFSSIAFTSRSAVLNVAQTFEDLGVGAYNGAGRYLTNEAFLLVAGKIVSVEARHAAAIRAIRNGNYTTAFAPDALDPALTPAQVLAAARGFVVQNIVVTNA
ncbi:ferritin-like domain-containing protein [Roseisolibacter sp. H3M3-2]|uniref:ferritin-like domain-containing protein n=1 Tax=Roseisolibacter sp. H3M3-2 TaxID=3031323 RepID=UPI0023D97CCC|nr:ferritin-like domain-containing protein [Roseisolibacter sp. H3M3-2]MDF1503950.1 ferritin-like domain-containing protein [Roseisolibacter sp. H3M3-2]